MSHRFSYKNIGDFVKDQENVLLKAFFPSFEEFHINMIYYLGLYIILTGNFLWVKAW